MGINICGFGAQQNNYFDFDNTNRIETNLKETQNINITSDDLRTKSGTEWNNISGLEKIMIIHKINYIIKKYREHLKSKNNKNI